MKKNLLLLISSLGSLGLLLIYYNYDSRPQENKIELPVECPMSIEILSPQVNQNLEFQGNILNTFANIVIENDYPIRFIEYNFNTSNKIIFQIKEACEERFEVTTQMIEGFRISFPNVELSEPMELDSLENRQLTSKLIFN